MQKEFKSNLPFFFNIDEEVELTHHNGTIRDLIFMHDNLKDDSILLSGGAGDCKIYVTDVKRQIPIRSYSGHQGEKILSKHFSFIMKYDVR